MEKIKLAILGDSLYAGRLTECIRKNSPDYLEVYGCRSLAQLPDYLKQIQPDILLYEMETAGEEKLPEYLLQIQITDNRQLCRENGLQRGRNEKSSCRQKDLKQDDAQNIRESLSRQPSVFRYQKGSEILRQIFQIYERSNKKNLSGWCRTLDLEMTAFYAPGGHELLLPISIAYAAVCGESDKVLYLNLAEFSGMAALLSDKDGKTFSDLIYGIRQKKDQFPLCLQSVLHHAEKFDYLLPPENPQDLYEVQKEDLECLVSLLQEKTDYRMVIWNCGALNRPVEQVFQCCSRVFGVVKDRSFGKYRKSEFERFLQKDLQRQLREKLQYVSPQSGSGTFVQGMDMMSQIQTGEFADQARDLLKKDRD